MTCLTELCTDGRPSSNRRTARLVPVIKELIGAFPGVVLEGSFNGVDGEVEVVAR